MVYIFYNSVSGEIIRAYDESCLPNVPTPNVAISSELWHQSVTERRKSYVDVTQDPPVFVLGEVDPVPAAPKRYSKLKIIRKAKETEALSRANETVTLWNYIKSFIQANNAEDEWLAAAWLQEDDALFVALTAQLSQEFPGFDIAGFLSDCLY